MEMVAHETLQWMNQELPRPVKCKEGRGVRNFKCGHYENCLDHAAKGMWTGFTCGKCEHYQC